MSDGCCVFDALPGPNALPVSCPAGVISKEACTSPAFNGTWQPSGSAACGSGTRQFGTRPMPLFGAGNNVGACGCALDPSAPAAATGLCAAAGTRPAPLFKSLLLGAGASGAAAKTGAFSQWMELNGTHPTVQGTVAALASGAPRVAAHVAEQFSKSVDRVLQSQADPRYTLALTKFAASDTAAITANLGFRHAFRSRRLGSAQVRQQPGTRQNALQLRADARAPPMLDWSLRGASVPAKNQASCGSCYIFAALRSLEGALALKTGVLVRLSEQLVLNRSASTGCEGGDPFEIFENGTLATVALEEDVPYKSAPKGVTSLPGRQFATGVLGAGVVVLPSTSVYDIEETLKAALTAHGPLSVAVAATDEWYLYARGILWPKPGDRLSLNHAVTLTGYGTTDAGEEYWTVANSWSPDWGEKGAIRLPRGKGVSMAGPFLMYQYPPCFARLSAQPLQLPPHVLQASVYATAELAPLPTAEDGGSSSGGVVSPIAPSGGGPVSPIAPPSSTPEVVVVPPEPEVVVPEPQPVCPACPQCPKPAPCPACPPSP
jgi:cathepsin L